MRAEGNKSIKKKELTTDKNLVIGTKNLKIHHEPVLGSDIIDLSNLITPVGFTNPSPTEISNMRLKDFSANWILTSNLRSLWIEKASYEILTNNSIRLKAGYESLANEVFIIQYFNYAYNGSLVADARPAGNSGTLVAGARDFNLGEAIPINDIANKFPISVIRGQRKLAVFRNTTNSEYVVPATPLTPDIYNKLKYINSVSLEGNDGRAITANSEDIQFNGNGIGWSSIGDVNEYIVQKDNSIINLSSSAQFTSNAPRVFSIYKNGVIYRNLGGHIIDAVSVFEGSYTSSQGEFSKDDTISLRISVTSTLLDAPSGHYFTLSETSNVDLPPVIGDYQMLDRGDGFCQILRFNIEGEVGDEEVTWANHGALTERPDLSVLQRVDKIHGIMDKMREDMYSVTGNDIADPTRYDEGVPTDSDLMAFGNLLSSILQVEVFSNPSENLVSTGYASGGGASAVTLANAHTNTSNVLLALNTATETRYEFLKVLSFIATANTLTSNTLLSIELYNQLDVLQYASNGLTGAGQRASTALTGEGNVGWYIILKTSGALSNDSLTNFSVTAHGIEKTKIRNLLV